MKRKSKSSVYPQIDPEDIIEILEQRTTKDVEAMITLIPEALDCDDTSFYMIDETDSKGIIYFFSHIRLHVN